jgi:hypothetical protein
MRVLQFGDHARSVFISGMFTGNDQQIRLSAFRGWEFTR